MYTVYMLYAMREMSSFANLYNTNLTFHIHQFNMQERNNLLKRSNSSPVLHVIQ